MLNKSEMQSTYTIFTKVWLSFGNAPQNDFVL